MENRLFATLEADAPLAADSLLKATSLLYLKDALEGERYEECAALIQSARSYGAGSREISSVIAKYLRKLDTSQDEAALKRTRQFT